MKKFDFNKWFQFALVVIAAGSIYPLVYLRTGYQATIIDVFGISAEQLGNIYSILGLTFVFGYIPSGWLADRISAKTLLFVSLLVTGLGGIWFSTIPSATGVQLVFILWGISSVLTFWSAHLKLVKMITGDSAQGKTFGILDGGRGLVEAILASIAAAIFTFVIGTSTDLATQESALVSVINMYAYFLIVISFLILFFVKAGTKVEKEVKAKQVNTLESFKKVLSNKSVWVMGGIILFSYTVTWSVYYFGYFLSENHGFTAVNVALVAALMLWMRPIGGTLAGFLADKFGRTTVLGAAQLGAAVVLVLLAILPSSLGSAAFIILVLLASLFIYGIRGLYWSLIGHTKLEVALLGLAIGVVSFFGYLGDVFIPQVTNVLYGAFDVTGGNSAYFIFNAVAGVAAFYLVTRFAKMIKKSPLKTEEE